MSLSLSTPRGNEIIYLSFLCPQVDSKALILVLGQILKKQSGTRKLQIPVAREPYGLFIIVLFLSFISFPVSPSQSF